MSSLRFQFLLPMLLAVSAAALGVTVCSKWFADRDARNATLQHFSKTGKLCVTARYPLTTSVLTQIQELSSLKLGIVSRETEKGLRLESKSSLFPPSEDLRWIEPLVVQAADSNGKTFFVAIDLEVDNQSNATAFMLPKQDSADENQRYLILLEPMSLSTRGSVQAFVLPLATGLSSSILIALVAAFVASRIGKRIERLGKHVEKIANGSFESIAPTGPSDAIYSLYESVNGMSQQLQKSSAQIAKNERSRLINLMASGLAHELRNHLTGARLAIQTCNPDSETREALSISLKQMKLAEESIQRLLTLRVDESDKMAEPMTFEQIQDSVRDLLQPIAVHQRVQLQMHACCDLENNLCHSSVLQHSVKDGSSIVGALINLGLNALEAAGPGGAVELSSRMLNGEGAKIEWQVKDSGPGPTAEIAETMFEPFATTKREGVGLGLAMCKRIAVRHAGDVTWRRKDGWTVFTMTICTGK
jgi:signal transduction histidine kinase